MPEFLRVLTANGKVHLCTRGELHGKRAIAHGYPTTKTKDILGLPSALRRTGEGNPNYTIGIVVPSEILGQALLQRGDGSLKCVAGHTFIWVADGALLIRIYVLAR